MARRERLERQGRPPRHPSGRSGRRRRAGWRSSAGRSVRVGIRRHGADDRRRGRDASSACIPESWFRSGVRNSLTIENAASGGYTLKVMTIAAGIFLPIVLLYQAWSYHVLRARLGGTPVGPGRRDRAKAPRVAGIEWRLLRRRAAGRPRRRRHTRGRRRAPRPRPGRPDRARRRPGLRRRLAAGCGHPAPPSGPSSSPGAHWQPGASRPSGDGPPWASSALRLDLVERLRASHALDGVESAEVATTAVAGVDALETAYARYLPQVVLAVVVPVAVSRSWPRSTSSRPGSCCSRCRSSRSSCGSSGATPRTGRAAAGRR